MFFRLFSPLFVIFLTIFNLPVSSTTPKKPQSSNFRNNDGVARKRLFFNSRDHDDDDEDEDKDDLGASPLQGGSENKVAKKLEFDDIDEDKSEVNGDDLEASPEKRGPAKRLRFDDEDEDKDDLGVSSLLNSSDKDNEDSSEEDSSDRSIQWELEDRLDDFGASDLVDDTIEWDLEEGEEEGANVASGPAPPPSQAAIPFLIYHDPETSRRPVPIFVDPVNGHNLEASPDRGGSDPQAAEPVEDEDKEAMQQTEAEKREAEKEAIAATKIAAAEAKAEKEKKEKNVKRLVSAALGASIRFQDQRGSSRECCNYDRLVRKDPTNARQILEESRKELEKQKKLQAKREKAKFEKQKNQENRVQP